MARKPQIADSADSPKRSLKYVQTKLFKLKYYILLGTIAEWQRMDTEICANKFVYTERLYITSSITIRPVRVNKDTNTLVVL